MMNNKKSVKNCGYNVKNYFVVAAAVVVPEA